MVTNRPENSIFFLLFGTHPITLFVSRYNILPRITGTYLSVPLLLTAYAWCMDIRSWLMCVAPSWSRELGRHAPYEVPWLSRSLSQNWRTWGRCVRQAGKRRLDSQQNRSQTPYLWYHCILKEKQKKIDSMIEQKSIAKKMSVSWLL